MERILELETERYVKKNKIPRDFFDKMFPLCTLHESIMP